MIVDARWLREHRDGARLILIDTRPVKDFHGGHLSGARHFDPFAFHHTDTSERGIAEFGAQPPVDIFGAGNHRPRDRRVLRESIRNARGARPVVAGYAGHPKARMLDGGLKAAGETLTTRVEKFAAADFELGPGAEFSRHMRILLDPIGRPGVQIFDVRSDEE